MLSNTDEMKPRPSVVSAVAAGRRSTGIIDAHSTSDSRNTLPLTASGTSDQSGWRQAAVTRIASATARPITGTWSSTAGWFRLK